MDIENGQNMDAETLEDLYQWVDKIPLSRPKRDIRRDFSDGVLVSEIIYYHNPHIIEMHSYTNTLNSTRKRSNWNLLNRKVFSKLGFMLADDVISNIINSQPWAIEQVLLLLRRKIDEYDQNQQKMQQERKQMDDKRNAVKAPPPVRKNFRETNTKFKPKLISSKNAAQNIQVSSISNLPIDAKLYIEEKEQELLAKEETIQILQAKIRRLEHLLHLKDIRLEDLQQRMDIAEFRNNPQNRTRNRFTNVKLIGKK